MNVAWTHRASPCNRVRIVLRMLCSSSCRVSISSARSKSLSRAELMAKTGRMAVPVIVVGDEIVAGFDRGRLQRLLGL